MAYSQQRKGRKVEIVTPSDKELTIPLIKHHNIFVRIDKVKETIYSDQTGTFPVKSKKSNRYIIIMSMCEMNSNAILSKPINSRDSGKLVQLYWVLLRFLKKAVLNPKKHVLDNEISSEFKEAIKNYDMDYELVPKGQHRRNIA